MAIVDGQKQSLRDVARTNGWDYSRVRRAYAAGNTTTHDIKAWIVAKLRTPRPRTNTHPGWNQGLYRKQDTG